MKKIVSGILSVLMACSLSVSAFAAEPPETATINPNSIVIAASLVEYTEYREDGEYFISEKVSESGITSTIYKIDGDQKTFYSTIESVVDDGIVKQVEVDQNGNSEETTLKAIITDVSSSQTGKTITARSGEGYLRTDEYSISLVGQKVTVATAAAAIVAVCNYIPTATASAIIKAAIKLVSIGAAGVAAGVAALPNYLYVTSEVYRSQSVGKIYYRYYNDYFLDADRTQLIGEWTFRHRAGH